MPTLTKTKTIALAEVRDLLAAEVLCGDDLTRKVEGAGAADLMSDVLALSHSGMLLLTGLVNVQVIRTAVVADLCGVVFVRGKRPGEDVLKVAREAGMPVLTTSLTMFEAAGLLYQAISHR